MCLVSPEFFHWGVHGGFGYVTWILGRKLSERGVDVYVVTPRRIGQRPQEEVNGVKVIGYESYNGYPYPVKAVASRLRSREAYREADCDIYHSQAVSFNTLAAETATPKQVHLITFQDPYDDEEWRKIAEVEPRFSMSPTMLSKIKVERRIQIEACKRANGLYTQAQFLGPRAKRLFRLKRLPGFLPNPVDIPRNIHEKSSEPTVCFLARWDPQKRVELFLSLARNFPKVRFIAMGKAHDQSRDRELRRAYGGVPNLELTGFVSEEEKREVLGKSWALVNTSIREALPISFLEALAHGAPIISGENPDGLTEAYGYIVNDGDYEFALRRMLCDPDWRRKGAEGRSYVKRIHEADKVVDLHLKVYQAHLEGRA